MEKNQEDLGERLERFVKEQASVFGEVISYVPAKLAVTTVQPSEPVAAKATPAAVVSSLTGLEERLAVHKNEPWYNAPSLEVLESQIHDCQKCRLGPLRKKFVFGVGNPNAKLMIIGEAPGADEDEQGIPFVGRAGQLLTKMLKAIEFEREDVYIANILKSRPPNNRDPKPDEVETCEPYLWKQISLIKPKIILCLGRIAGTNLLKTNESLGKMRGQVFDLFGVNVVVTYHPAALLRNPDWKHGAWEDLKKVRRMYDELEA